MVFAKRVTGTMHIAILGCGLVGSALIEQLAELANPFLKVVVIANSKKYLSNRNLEAIDLPLWTREFGTKASPYNGVEEIVEYLAHANAKMAESGIIIVDCTASDELPKYYERLLEHCFITTANKKGLSGSWSLFNQIRTRRDQNRTSLFYEATVGAGLPVISTLRDLIETGDQVYKIEGIFSGTLSYIFNVFGQGDATFSQVVKEAKENGYTEPDPRDDLNGMDVARKLIILARTLGMEVEGPPSSSIFPIESLIPPALENVRTGEEFLAGLPTHDAAWEKKREASVKENKVLRYVGSIEVIEGKIKVGLESYPLSHPFASLQGSDNIIAFHTKRYGQRPLIIQGAGAGAQVTAMGLLTDILKICERAH